MAFSLPVPFRSRALVRRTVTPVLSETLSTAAPAMPAPRVGRIVVKKYGTLGAFLHPIGIAIGWVIIGVVAVWGANTFLASEARRALHDSAVVQGNTVVQAPVT